jgi:adenine/guanine phosphoribosyltransferase-like PRPP-binding protein
MEVDVNAILPYTREFDQLCLAIAHLCLLDGVEAVIGPANDGNILANGVAYHLSQLSGHGEVLGVCTFRGSTGNYEIEPSHQGFIRGKRVLIVTGVIASIDTIRRFIESVAILTNKIVGVAVLVNQTSATAIDMSDGMTKIAMISLKTIGSSERADSRPPCIAGISAAIAPVTVP